MLNPKWKNETYEQDLNSWNRIRHTPPEFLSLRYTDIKNLLSKYAVTEAGGNLNIDRFSERQRFRILEKTMQALEVAISHEKYEESNKYHDQQFQQMDEGGRLEVEKGLYESRTSSIKLSKRDK